MFYCETEFRLQPYCYQGTDWCGHVLSVERTYWLKEIAVEEEHQAVMIDLAGTPSTAPILTLPARKRTCEIICI